jgi:hypothetical protein
MPPAKPRAKGGRDDGMLATVAEQHDDPAGRLPLGRPDDAGRWASAGRSLGAAQPARPQLGARVVRRLGVDQPGVLPRRGQIRRVEQADQPQRLQRLEQQEALARHGVTWQIAPLRGDRPVVAVAGRPFVESSSRAQARPSASRPMVAWRRDTGPSAGAHARTRASDLQQAERWRSAPSQHRRIVRCAVDPRLMWHTWMCLPTAGPTAPTPVVIDVPFPAPACRRRIWRGLHDGAHLDHLAASTQATHAAPSPAEFGQGLVAAESYATATEILATAECLLAGDTHTVNDLRAGLIERIGRIPRYGEWHSGSRERSPALDEAAIVPSVEFTTLPYLAGSYVTGPLRLLSRPPPPPLLPDRLHEALRRRWAAACDQFAPAAALTKEASEIG